VVNGVLRPPPTEIEHAFAVALAEWPNVLD
jgi:hypothetical protein